MVDESRTKLAAELAALRVRVRELESSDQKRLPRSAAERVLESSNDGALWVDREGRISFFNSVANDITGWTVDDALGSDVSSVITPADPDTEHPIHRVIATGATEHHERFALRTRTGTQIEVRISAAPLKLRGEIAGAVASFNLVGAPRTSNAAGFSQAQLDALIEVASADEASDASFTDVAEALLDSLVVATGADRVVLLVTERPDTRAGQLVIEAPSAHRQPIDEEEGHTARTLEAADAELVNDLPSMDDDGVKSMVALPLKQGDRVVGMLSAVSGKQDHFDRNRVKMLTASVDRLVMAYQRRKWQEDAEMLTVSSETLYSASRIMASHGGFDEKAAALLRLAVRTAGGTASALLGAERQGGALRCLAGGPFEADLQPEHVAHSIVGRAQSQKAVSALYATEDDRIVHGLDPDARFAVAAPVLVAGEVHGILLVAGPSDVKLAPDQLRLLSAIAENIGVLLVSARLGQRVNASLDREFAVLEAVKAAAERLAIVDTPAHALGHLVEVSRDVVGARIGGVAVWRRSGALETIISSDPAHGGLLFRQPESGIVPEVLRLVRYSLVQERRRSILVNDSPFTEGGEEMGAGFNSVLGVPFTCTDGRTGAIFLVDKEPNGRFTVEDERLLGLFCAMASVLLDNIRLFRAEERERRTLDAVHTSMAEGLIVLDEDGQVMFCNRAAETIIEVGQTEIRGRSLRAWVLRNAERFTEPERAKVFARMLETFHQGATELAVLGETRKDVTFSLFPIDVTDGERLMGVLLRDVTEEREHERRRDTFVSIASHELRGPMTTVMGFTELMMSGEYPPERRAAWLKHIYDDSTRVVTIVEDLLNVSRIQAGKLDFAIEPMDLGPVLQDTAERYRTTSDKHTLAVDTPSDLPLVMADRNKLTQVVSNLVSNAIKYSPNGGTVTLAATYQPADEHVIVSVTDEGMGIAEKDQARLFHTFQRIERPEMDGIKGTGLGLYIVKGLVNNMGGNIWLESAENQGSTFFVSIPIVGAGEEAAA